MHIFCSNVWIFSTSDTVDILCIYFIQISAPIKQYLRSISDRLGILTVISFAQKFEKKK